MSDEIAIAVARLETKVDMMLDQQKGLAVKLDAQDKRLRGVEVKSAMYGTIGGSVMGVGISLLVAAMKSKVGMS